MAAPHLFDELTTYGQASGPFFDRKPRPLDTSAPPRTGLQAALRLAMRQNLYRGKDTGSGVRPWTRPEPLGKGSIRLAIAAQLIRTIDHRGGLYSESPGRGTIPTQSSGQRARSPRTAGLGPSTVPSARRLSSSPRGKEALRNDGARETRCRSRHRRGRTRRPKSAEVGRGGRRRPPSPLLARARWGACTRPRQTLEGPVSLQNLCEEPRERKLLKRPFWVGQVRNN